MNNNIKNKVMAKAMDFNCILIDKYNWFLLRCTLEEAKIKIKDC